MFILEELTQETKEERKNSLIEYGRKINADMEKDENLTSTTYRALFHKALQIERALEKEFGMDEEEIFEALN